LLLSLSCGEKIPKECEEFYSLTAAQQIEVFKQYPVERQYPIYRCGTTQMHPPDMGLAIYIAEGGQKNIPFLLQKLKDEDSEPMRRYIILVFDLMANRGYLRGRTDVATEVEIAVAGMKIPFLKEMSRQSLKKINDSL
jgi:hypothetical protein